MDLLQINRENVARHIEEFSKIGRLGESASDGFLRSGWSPEESLMFKRIKKYSESIGLSAYYDDIGNLFMGTLNGYDKVIQIGSHLDSVVGGGNYDGVAGIVSGVEAVRTICESNVKLSKDLEIVVWRGEESATYGAAYKGSRAAFGFASPNMLSNRFQGKTLEDAIKGEGFDSGCIRDGRAIIRQCDVDRIAAHLELHIEQGKKLEMDKIDIGNITSVRGYSRYLVKVMGEFDHSGATPMGFQYRRDVNLAMDYMGVELDRLAWWAKGRGFDLVQTKNNNSGFGDESLDLGKSAITKVAGFGYFTLDIRGNYDIDRKAYAFGACNTIRNVAKKLNVDVEISEIDSSCALESLSPDVQIKIREACNHYGYSSVSMPSGAGHDAVVVSKAVRTDGSNIPVGMIFIPCKNGKSHCKEEYSSIESISKGADVLAHTVYSLAR